VADVGGMLEALAQPFDHPILRETHGAVLLRSAGPDFQIRPRLYVFAVPVFSA